MTKQGRDGESSNDGGPLFWHIGRIGRWITNESPHCVETRKQIPVPDGLPVPRTGPALTVSLCCPIIPFNVNNATELANYAVSAVFRVLTTLAGIKQWWFAVTGTKSRGVDAKVAPDIDFPPTHEEQTRKTSVLMRIHRSDGNGW